MFQWLLSLPLCFAISLFSFPGLAQSFEDVSNIELCSDQAEFLVDQKAEAIIMVNHLREELSGKIEGQEVNMMGFSLSLIHI